MRFRVVLALLGALVAFFGVSLVAERVASAAPLAQGAPVCDDRGASAYAAEPDPLPVDGGDITAAPEGGCKTHAALSEAASSSSSDDLQRTPEPPQEATTLVPAPVEPPPAIASERAERALEDDGARDGHPQNDNPPPRPIPWRG